MKRMIHSWCLATALAAAQTPAAAASVALWDQSFLGLGAGFEITQRATLNDFQLGSASAIDGVRLWLTEGRPAFGGNGVADGGFDTFEGHLWLTFWSDVQGAPGALLDQRTVVPTIVDTGINTVVPMTEDIMEVTVSFATPLLLGAGRHWLGVREGTSGAPGDDTELMWAVTTPDGSGLYIFNNGQDLADLVGPSQGEAAFQVFGTVADVPEPATSALMLAGLLAVGLARPRRFAPGLTAAAHARSGRPA